MNLSLGVQCNLGNTKPEPPRSKWDISAYCVTGNIVVTSIRLPPHLTSDLGIYKVSEFSCRKLICFCKGSLTGREKYVNHAPRN
jgi:hypothetical protein